MEKLKQLKKDAIMGYDCPLRVLGEIKKAIDTLTKYKEELLEDAITEREKYPEKEYVLGDFGISFNNGGKYDYSSNEDWNGLKKEMKVIEKNMQMAYKSNATILDEKTGEVYQPAVFEANKTSLTFKYLK